MSAASLWRKTKLKHGIKAPYGFEFALSFGIEDEEIMPEDVIESYKVLSEGCDELVVSKHGTTHGYPAPVVEYIVNDKVDPETLLRQVVSRRLLLRHRLVLSFCLPT